VDRKGF